MPRKYDFSRVGRMKFNIKLHDKADATPLDKRTLDHKDFIDTIQYLLKLRRGHRVGGRYRSPGQPPRPRGGRAARKPVPHRPGAHGARHQGKDERVPGNVDGHAARPGQRQAGDGGDPRILRIVAAFAVHGSDQSAVARSRTSGVCRPLDQAACRASARDSKSATCIPRTTAASARLKRRKVRTSD